MKILILLLLANFPAGILEDRNGDGVTDYVNAQIYVADDPTPSELSAAANIAARLAFESLSIDLPIGFPISSFSTNDTSVAIVVGRAASRFAGGQSEGVIDSTDGTRRVIAIPSVLEAEEWAASLEIPQPEPGEEAEEEEVEGEEEEDTSDKPVDENLGAKSYSLARLYTPDGLFGDSDKNFIPDTMETTIYLGPDTSSIRVIDLGARIGLETTGLRLPLVVVADEEQTPQNPVLIGMTNPHVRKLIEDEKFSPSLRGGQGRVEVVVNAFKKDHRALVLVGGDAPGEDRVIEHVAERLPYAWDYGKDNLHLVKIEDDLRRFFSLRSPEAQASAALYKARRMAAKLEGKDLEFAELKVFIERGGDEVLEHIRNEFPSFTVTAANIDVMSAEPVFEETFSIPWEVADVREMISSKLLAEVHSGAAVRLEVRVSESPEIRAQLHTELRDALLGRGADPENTEVRVLSAYKQGYSWINDILKPQLGNASEIKIYFRELEPEGWQTIESPIRWLQELFPVDEVLARDLDIPLENITFEKTTAGPIYRVEAEDSEGRRFLNESFDPQFVFRPMFDKFPQYEQVRVTTGWVHARIDGLTLLDERVKTDPERFWDEFQQRVFGQIHDYVLELYEGKPRARWAPYFGALEVDLWMSEPNYRIGIDEEQISSLEAVHEDIFFETLLFFDLIGQYYAGERLTYPGRVIPRIRPSREGTAGTARIRFTGKQGPNPRVDLEFRERGKLKQRWTEDFWPVNIEAPKIVAETVRTGHEGVVALEFLQQTDSEENQRDELITKARGEAIDRTLLSSEQAAAMVENIQEFHDLGFGTRWLSYDGVDEIRVRFRTTDDVESQASVSRTAEGYYRVPKMEASQPSDEPIVQWDNPINTTETEQIISELASFPEVRPFYTTSSYLGKRIWAMDVMSPFAGHFFSQAKASTTKPVLFITGRQHANEVSSTSHILRLVELLTTDPDYKPILDRVNFIIHPITNPDGADLAYELQEMTPDFMLHAGYLGSLGVDVTSGQWSANPMYPETSVRKDLWEMWLPDIVLNPHGYPSHEWVQLFAGYSAWVRSRTPNGRAWWAPRGWFMPGFNYIQDPKFEDHKTTAFAIRDRIAAAISATVPELNERMYSRRRKYGEWDVDNYKENIYNDVMIYSALKGSKQSSSSNSFMVRHPNVTVFQGTTEAPDETARGEWLQMVAGAGLQFDLAHARFLAESKYEVKRTRKDYLDATIFTINRKRPVLPPDEPEEPQN